MRSSSAAELNDLTAVNVSIGGRKPLNNGLDRLSIHHISLKAIFFRRTKNSILITASVMILTPDHHR
jgi:hypothetical protein